MEFNKLVVAGLAVGCLTAAAGGSYLAVRQNQSASAQAPSGELLRDGAAVSASAPADASGAGRYRAARRSRRRSASF